jgi:hypothetical protein
VRVTHERLPFVAEAAFGSRLRGSELKVVTGIN